MKLRFSSKQRMRKDKKTINKLKNKSIIDEEYINIEDELDDQEFKIAKIASDFLGKQLEA